MGPRHRVCTLPPPACRCPEPEGCQVPGNSSDNITFPYQGCQLLDLSVFLRTSVNTGEIKVSGPNVSFTTGPHRRRRRRCTPCQACALARRARCSRAHTLRRGDLLLWVAPSPGPGCADPSPAAVLLVPIPGLPLSCCRHPTDVHCAEAQWL